MRHFQACLVELTLFFPVFRLSAFPQFIEYSRALTAPILPSIPTCYPDVAPDSPHCRDPIKTCKNIWEVRLPGMQLEIVASQQRNKRAVRSFYEGIRPTRQRSRSLINGPLKHSGSLMCSEKNVNVALPVMTPSVSK